MSNRAATTERGRAGLGAVSALRTLAPLAALAEAVTLLGVMVVVNLYAFRRDPGFVSVSPHPMLVITLLLTARYGFATGLVTAGLSTVAYVALLLGLTDLPSWQHLAEAPWSTPIAVLVPMTVGFGMLVQQHLTKLAAAEAARDVLASENARLELEQAELRDVNVELAGKVVGAGGSLQALYEYAKDLNVTDVVQLYAGLTRLLEEVLQAEAVTVWTTGPDGALTLAARRGAGETPQAPNVTPRLAACFDARGVLSLHDVPGDIRPTQFPYLVGRIHQGRGGPLIGYLCIERLPFARYNAEAIRLFSLVVDWASSSIGNALTMTPQRTPDRTSAPRPLAPRPPLPAPPAASEVERTTRARAAALEPTPPQLPHHAQEPFPESATVMKRRPAAQGISELLDETNLLLNSSVRPSPRATPPRATPPRDGGDRPAPRAGTLGQLLDEVAGYLDDAVKREKGPP